MRMQTSTVTSALDRHKPEEHEKLSRFAFMVGRSKNIRGVKH